MSRPLVLLWTSVLALSCATVSPRLGPAAVGDEDALADAVEHFYRAADPEDLRAAVRAAQAIAPRSARYHEIAALTGRSERTARQHAGVVYEKSGLGGRAELSAFFLQDLMLPETERSVLQVSGPAGIEAP